MDAIVRGAAIYLFLLLVFRVAGTRTLAEVTTFDFVLLLIIGEATQQALLGDDFSLTNAFILITTLLAMEVAMSLAGSRLPRLARLINGLPVVLVEEGRPFEDRMRAARVDLSDILEAARQSQGLERLEQIKYAVLERSGGISVVPKG